MVVDIARAGHALDLDFHRVGHARELEGAARRIGGPERQADDRHVVDALRLDDGFPHAERRRQPVLVGFERVVEPDERFRRVLADLVLDRQHRHAGTRNRVHVIDAGDPCEHLFRRRRHEVLDVLRRGTWERDEDVRHRHVDLRLFLARRDEHGEHAQQQRDERDQRCQA
jgi:hypothetical protein